jgi:hypothetical protein
MRSLPYSISEPPEALKKARFDNIALVPASLLPLKSTYQPLANTLHTGSVLCVPGTRKQKKIIALVTAFFRRHGRSVVTLPLERINRQKPSTARPKPENVQLAF